MEPYPLLFEPILKPKVWGGRALETLGKKLPPGEKIGESWELADLPESVPDGRSVIANGALQGITLRAAIEAHRALIMGDDKLARDATRGQVFSGFPLLIKFLDARENLSVQVHPTPEYVQRHPDAHLKSEAWIVVHADPGAVIYKGVREGLSPVEFAEHIRNNTVVNDLIEVPVQRGDFHYLPSGTCHALGAGIVVAEIQTPSDTTFRVYDWGRDPEQVGGRQLHIDQALQCIHFGPSQHNLPRLHKPMEVRGVRTTPLAITEHFEIDRVDSLSMARFELVVSGLPEVWMMLDGAGRMESPRGELVDLHPGATVLVPASLNGWCLSLARSSWLVRVRLPSPLKGMIAGV